jgi:hypothetical protein
MSRNCGPVDLEELGSRTLPSTTLGTPLVGGVLAGAPATGPIAVTTTTATHPLAGQGQGTFTNPVTPGALTIDALTTYNFNGTANLAAMGQVRITGTIHSVGFLLRGQAAGQLTFSNSRGSVTIQLTGPLQPGYTGYPTLPTVFSYTVVARTGAFAQLADHGTLGLVVYPQLFNYTPQPFGTFAISL